ncbi:MAG: hypothetical protein CMJ89_10145 [Planctomycetes bacterium]|nr:hypothetical protein [Planctomycetota bacterium]
MKGLLWIGAGVVVFGANAATQDPGKFLEGVVVRAAPAPQEPQSAEEEEGEDGEEKKEPSALQKKLAKLTYDRRPSVILKAWSTPPESEEEQEQAPENASEEGATLEAALDGEQSPGPEEEVSEEVLEEAQDGEAEPEEEKTEEELKEEAEEAAKAAEKAAEKAKKEAEAKANKEEKERIEKEAKELQRNVTLGDWEAVGEYLASITEEEAKAGYKQMLVSLVKGPKKPQGRFANWAEKNFFAPADVLGLTVAAPIDHEDGNLTQLGLLLSQSINAGGLLEKSLELFQGVFESEEPELDRQDVARILMGANFPVEAGEFLPSPETAISENDRAALNLLSRHFLAKHAEDKKEGFLEQAWTVLQAVLASGEVEDKDKEEALKRAVDIAPRIREELGQSWLDESFTSRPERGMEILAVIGGSSSNALMDKALDADARFKNLELQTTAAEALLKAAPERAPQWASTLSLLAANWLREAIYTYKNDKSTQRGPSMQRDFYGNFYYYNSSFNRPSKSTPAPITTDKILDIRPSAGWMPFVAEGLRPKFAILLAQLLLKVNEETEAFPHIERLALVHPERAKELVEEFLRVWAKNHNPNDKNNRRNRYVYFYGYEQRADAIPLTRSKQERNLVELAEWVARIRQLPLEDLDEELIAAAFTSAHSIAEVYRLETIEEVFGSMHDLEPEILAQLVQKMRTNLVGVWRQPNTQKENKTKRRQRDIQGEILRGYQVARSVTEEALADHPENWQLMLARASVMHDENNFRQELAQDSKFSGNRQEAFREFERAAEMYAAQVEDLLEEEETTKVFETWFYASLGACDLGAVDERKQAVAAQIERIRGVLESLPDERAEHHMDMFSNTLFTRMGSVNPAVKFTYVRNGLDIVGDNERAEEARKVYQYYRDLVTEIQLETVVDGEDRVGSEKPFGLYVNLRHTKEIEREAGGFSKYLTNQNNQRFAWNYGRPTENYRDKFEDVAREALSEHFEVLSVTFNHPDTHSRALEEYGWRVTPYAYLLLKARGPEVDRVPSLHLDIDFLDTSGYAVLPVESSPVAIEASSPQREERPFEKLKLTQTLDERQADKGKLLLEVQASALGLVPDLEAFLDLGSEGFEIVSAEDQGVSVAKFDEEGEEVAIVSERIWSIAMEAKEGLTELPKEFRFGRPLVEEVEVDYQRYDDADLQSVAAVISLEEIYGERSISILPWFFALLAVAGVSFGWVRLRRVRKVVAPSGPFRMPDSVSAFTVIGLLEQIDAKNGLNRPQREELRSQIDELEGFYFREGGGETPDLRRIAESWIGRASRPTSPR